MAVYDLLFLVILLASGVHAIPTIAFPLNSQVPPVARTLEPFSYTFSSSTFFSDFPITYTLSTGPKWLSLDGPARTLSGTPSKADVGPGDVVGVPISITATDSTGSTYLNSTLVVSTNTGPVVKIPTTGQLPSFGIFSPPATLLYHPSSPFKFQFDRETFSGSDLYYYAVSADNTPLPSWVDFDGAALSFSGQTPDYASLIQPPQIFGIRLIASDVEGFAAASLEFEFEVGVHLLVISADDLVISATAGEVINFTGLADAIKIDGRQAKPSEIVSVTANTPEWLKFDETTQTFSGTVPKDATSTNITVTVVDIYEDTASITIPVQITSTGIFRTEIGDLNVTAGTEFEYDLSSYFYDASDVEVSAQISPKEAWIEFDSEKTILSGNIPKSAQTPEIVVSLDAKSKTSDATASQDFHVFVEEVSTKPSISSTASASKTSTLPVASSTESSVTPPLASESGVNKAIILAITIPLVLLFLCALLVFCCCLRRRRREDEEQSVTISKSDISLPREDETAESVIEIITTTRAAPPEPLQLDTSDFGRPTSTGLLLGGPPKSPIPKPQQVVRRSRTVSDLSDNRLSKILRESDSAANRGRSLSDNALCKTEKSWSTTQASTASTIPSIKRTSSHRLSRNYSNYSRKGHARRSARVISSRDLHNLQFGVDQQPSSLDPIKPIPNIHQGDSILNLTDSNFSLLPIDTFSALSLHAPFILPPSNRNSATKPILERPSRAHSSRRHSRFLPNFSIPPSSGLGHGGRDSISPLSSVLESSIKGSIGHGQEPPSFLKRDSRTWRTIAAQDSSGSAAVANRESATSFYTRYPPDTPGLPMTTRYSNVYLTNQRMSIRLVPKSSSDASLNPYHTFNTIDESGKASSTFSSSTRASRPVSRRIGSSPFFGGDSLRNSSITNGKRKSSLNRLNSNVKRAIVARTSYADSPTVPEEVSTSILPSIGTAISQPNPPGLEESIMHTLRNVSDDLHHNSQRDSFGISYGLAREGTRQLKSYIERRLTRGSLKSFDTGDSRFESAEPSMMDLSQRGVESNLNLLVPMESFERPPRPGGRGGLYARQRRGEEWKESSWETLHTSRVQGERGGGEEISDVEGVEEEDVATARVVVERGRASLVSSVAGSGSGGSGEGRRNRNVPGRNGRDGYGQGGMKGGVNRGPDVRLVPGKARRPISVDVDAQIDRKRSSKVMIEGSSSGREGGEKMKEKEKDYRVYI